MMKIFVPNAVCLAEKWTIDFKGVILIICKILNGRAIYGANS